jgi:hypothetical protein
MSVDACLMTGKAGLCAVSRKDLRGKSLQGINT